MASHVVSVFGPFNSRALVEMSVEDAAEIFGDGGLRAAAPHNVIDAVRGDLEAMPAEVAGSALAAVAVALAYELEHPFNSATSKSMCAGQLRECLKELRSIAPAGEESDGLDALRADFDADASDPRGAAAPSPVGS